MMSFGQSKGAIGGGGGGGGDVMDDLIETVERYP